MGEQDQGSQPTVPEELLYKLSTTCFISPQLHDAGFRVGRFASPALKPELKARAHPAFYHRHDLCQLGGNS